jgi:hypothetical protein
LNNIIFFLQYSILDKDRGKIVFVQYVICYISMLTTKYQLVITLHCNLPYLYF